MTGRWSRSLVALGLAAVGAAPMAGTVRPRRAARPQGQPRELVEILQGKGADGWETVSLSPEHSFTDRESVTYGDALGSRVRVYRAVFKRAKE